ncbi:MAG: HD domain-containing protein [Desulfurococcaceae archaeon]
MLRGMCDPHKLEILVSIAKALYEKSIEHGIHHVERVFKWALRIIKEEGLNVSFEAVRIATYLHDLGRLVGDPHAYYSSLIGEELLKEAACSDNVIREIILAVEAHSFSRVKSAEKVNELGKVLSDADKLDALGLVGFLRVFMYSERRGRDVVSTLKHFNDKIVKLHKYMYYEDSRKMAERYSERTNQLLKWLEEELT